MSIQTPGVKISFDNLPSPSTTDGVKTLPFTLQTATTQPYHPACDLDLSNTADRKEAFNGRLDPWNSNAQPWKPENHTIGVSNKDVPLAYQSTEEQLRKHNEILLANGHEYMKNLNEINDVIKTHVAHQPNYPETMATDEELDRAAEAKAKYEKEYNERKGQKCADEFYKVMKDNTATIQFAKEHGLTDAQVYDTIKANEESVAGDKKVVWVSAVLADEIQHRIDDIASAFGNMIHKESNCFTDREKVKITDNCDALIAVDPYMLELFIKNFKYSAKRSDDLITCIPEKPVEVPLHPQHNVNSSIRNSEKVAEKETEPETETANEKVSTAVGEDDNMRIARENAHKDMKELYGDPNAKEFEPKNEDPIDSNPFEKAKLRYESGEFDLTPDGVESIVRGHTPVLSAWHEGDDPAVGPTITPQQWMHDVTEIGKINKSFAIPGANPYDPSTVNRFTDDYKRLKTANSTPTPPSKPTAWTADGHPADYGRNYGRTEAAKVEKKTPLMPKVYDVPKEMVDMVEHLPNDLWRYNVVQDENAIKLTLNYDARPRHIHIIVNTGDEEVTINTNREFRGSYSTTLSWDSSAADESLCPNRQRLFRWLRAWIKDIME